jgi:hypothetical protein
LAASLWKLVHLICGHYPPFWLHLLNLLLHVTNGTLVGALAYLVGDERGRYIRALTATLLFTAYPFSYQTVPWVTSAYHPLLLCLLLSAGICYWQVRRGRGRGWEVGLLTALLLAPFTHETGAMVGPLLGAVELARWLRAGGKPHLRWPALGLTLGACYLLLWSQLPKQDSSLMQLTRPWELWQNAHYYLQGLTYPLALGAQALSARTAVNPLTAVGVVGGLTLVAGVWVVARTGQRPLGALALTWFPLALAPAWALLSFDYVVNSPRLLYVAGAGAAWLWAGVLTAPWHLSTGTRSLKRLSFGLAGAALVLLLTHNGAFVRERIVLYDALRPTIEQLTAISVARAGEQRPLAVNLPGWVSPRRRTYALGNHGIPWLADYVSLPEVVFANSGRTAPVATLEFDNLLQTPEAYWQGVYGAPQGWEGVTEALRREGDAFLTIYTAERIWLAAAGRVYPPAPAPMSPAATFGEGIHLLESVYAPLTGHLTLHWQVEVPPQREYTVFVHLYDEQGTLVAQADGEPLLGLFPFWLWRPEERARDVRHLPPASELPPGAYRVGLGLYDRAGGARVPARTGAGDRPPDEVVIVGRFRVGPTPPGG